MPSNTDPRASAELHHHAIVAEGLGKRYGDRWVLRGVDLVVPHGTILGLLGPNGAGKTTTVRILTTLLRPDEGHARVDGIDVVRDPAAVRPRIGLAGQSATVDELLTGRSNLEMVGRLYHLPRREARRRASDVLERFGLTDAANKLVRDYSGGMRRRLDLAASLVGEPPILFLDEPTTGLDPRSRNELLDMLRDLVREGTTVLLTTQYLEEADRLAGQIAVVDAGRVIASGTPAELKARIGGSRVVLSVHEPADLARAAATLERFAAEAPHIDAGTLEVSAPVAADTPLVEVLRALDGAGVVTKDLGLRSPSLDDVFLTLTGHDTVEREAA